jgi:MFS transporter, UMF1 family
MLHKNTEPGGEQELTSRSEIYAWWVYFTGYEPLSIVAAQVLIPVILTKFSVSQAINVATGEACESGQRCLLFSLGSLKISPLSFSYFITFISILSQAVCFVFLGSLAHFGNLRKKLLIGCTIVGSLLTMTFSAAYGPQMLWLVALLSVLISTVYGSTLVFYNAYLPLLVNNHPLVINNELQEVSKPTEGIDNGTETSNGLSLKKDQLASNISTKGIIFGYTSALLVLGLSVLMIYFVPYQGISSVAVGFTGLWWLFIGIPSSYWFKSRPGQKLPAGTFFLKASIKSISSALSHIGKLPDTKRFLFAYLFIAGGYGTIGYAAVTFATKELGITQQKSLLAVILLLVTSMAGGFTFLMIQRVFKITSLKMAIGLTILESFIPIYGITGIFSKKIGLRNLWEAFLIAGYHGFIIGAIQSFTRVSFSELLPKGHESECFAVYGITERIGTSLGLLMMTVIDLLLNESRWCFVVLFAMLLLPLPILIKGVNFERGRQNALKVDSKVAVQ